MPSATFIQPTSDQQTPVCLTKDPQKSYELLRKMGTFQGSHGFDLGGDLQVPRAGRTADGRLRGAVLQDVTYTL